MAIRFDGRKFSDSIFLKLSQKVKEKKLTPVLGIILLGNDPASLSYIKQKLKKAKVIGVRVIFLHLPAETSEKELLEHIEKFNKDTKITGYIVQLPIPIHINQEHVFEVIDPEKDLDAFNPQTKFSPPSALAILAILKEAGIFNVRGKRILVIGKGQTAGKPIIMELIRLEARVTMADRNTKNIPQIAKEMDAVISCVGHKDLIKGEMLKEGAVAIGVGVVKGKDGKLHGDLEEESVSKMASFYTPTPGGVGPVTVAFLLSNLVKAAVRND